MFDWMQSAVQEFHTKFHRLVGQPTLAEQRGPVGQVKLPKTGEANFPEAIDALIDLEYVTKGSGVTFGVCLADVFPYVHQANMAKTGGGERDDGKILKPPGWKPPDIEGALRSMGWKGHS